jgi:pimeloyl-ACP methyl ester carboxylesterase
MTTVTTRRELLVVLMYKVIDAYIYMCVEYVKTFIRECVLLVSQLVNLLTSLLLHVLHKPGHYDLNVSYKPKKLSFERSNTPNNESFFSLLSKSFVRGVEPTLQMNQSPLPEVQSYSIQGRKPSVLSPAAVISIEQDNNEPVGKRTKDKLNRILSETLLADECNALISNNNTLLSDEYDENRRREEEEENLEEEIVNMDVEVISDTRLISKIFQYMLSVIMWFIMLIWYIPSLFEPARNHSFVNNDRVYLHEKKSTGLLEDFVVALLDFSDAMAYSFRLLIRFEFTKCWEQVKYAFGLFKPSSFISHEGIDDRSIEQVIIDEGYPHASYACNTQDGYIVQLDRIPNKTARKVVYFQHGILDSGFAWVGNGATHSLALRVCDLKDIDVFLGNFRGYGLSPYHLKTTKEFNKKDYWDYSFNEHAFYDVRAFVEKIVELKKKELGDNNFKIIVVAHSMGAGTILAYLVHSKLTNQQHHLSRAILLAPAGNHKKIPFLLNFLSYTGLPLAKIILPYFGFTTRTNRILIAKLVQDFNNHPALRSLLAVIISKTILGGQSSNSPFQYVHNLVYHIFQGTSINVVVHFVQMVRTGKFQAFDYGSEEENRKHYGQATPWNFFDYYGQIDPMIPISVLYGEDDKVIPSENVLKHTNELLKYYSSDLIQVKKFTDCGHLELTFGCNVKIINHVLKTIQLHDE